MLRPVSPRTNRSAWASAENEKQRLYELAQARVRETQGQVMMPPSAAGSILPSGSNLQTRSEFRHPHTDMQSQATPRPTRSAGAALYSRAIEQINRSSTIPAPPPPHLSEARRNTSLAINNRSAVQEKSALLYYQAKQNVHRHLQEQGEAVSQEDGPIPYEQLFGEKTVASSSNHGHPPPTSLSEKELLRRHHEQQDAITTPAQNNFERSQPLPHQANRTSSIRLPNPDSPTAALSEKERMRRAFEARDAALRAAGQVPPPILPEYDPPASVNGMSNQSPLSAVDEKRQLAERYGVGGGGNLDFSTTPMPPPPPQPQAAISLAEVVTSSPSQERPVQSELSVGETFLKRDPSVSAGKRRQMNIGRESPPPPPLPPRPPQEYIEETRREDHRTTLRNALPLDFSTSFDLGFDNFGKDGHDARLA